MRHPAPSIDPGVCYGRLDVGIAAGAEIDRMVSDPRLAAARSVLSSPAVRCRGVAEAIAASLGVPLTMDERLLELDFGDWEGRLWSSVGRDDLDRWAADPLGFAAPGGELGAALVARVTEFHAALHEDCAVVSHGGPLKVLAALLKGCPVDLLAVAPALGSITIC